MERVEIVKGIYVVHAVIPVEVLLALQALERSWLPESIKRLSVGEKVGIGSLCPLNATFLVDESAGDVYNRLIDLDFFGGF